MGQKKRKKDKVIQLQTSDGQQSSSAIHPMKFLGLFTATHFSFCTFVTGFILILAGIFCIAFSNLQSQPSSTTESNLSTALRTVGISFTVFGSVLLAMAVGVFIAAIKWGKKKVFVLERPVYSQPVVISCSGQHPTQHPPYQYPYQQAGGGIGQPGGSSTSMDNHYHQNGSHLHSIDPTGLIPFHPSSIQTTGQSTYVQIPATAPTIDTILS